MPSFSRISLGWAWAFVFACSETPPLGGINEACEAELPCATGLQCSGGVCVVGDDDTQKQNNDRDAGENPSDAGGEADSGVVDTDAGVGDGGGGCGACNTPPSACYETQGTCQNEVCVYPLVDGASCDDGNPCTIADTCGQGACSGTPMVCNAPPANVCVSQTQLQRYDQAGMCQSGRCVYASTVEACQGQCINGSCDSDPCDSVVCNSPPSQCFSSAGVCENGSCNYPYNNGQSCDDGNSCTQQDSCQTGVCIGAPMVCNNPPANSCLNSSTLQVYAPQGSCNLGQCSYVPSFVNCVNGCINGACASSGWTLMNSNTNDNLRSIWGSSPTSIWAGGYNGTLVYYNGVQWQPQGPNFFSEIGLLHGTTSNNIVGVFGGGLIYYDGVSWEQVPQTTLMTSAIATGPHSFYAFKRVSSTDSALYRFVRTSGVWSSQLLLPLVNRASTYYGFQRSAEDGNGGYVLPGGVLWDGQSSTQALGQATYSGTGPQQMLFLGTSLLGLSWENGATPVYRLHSGTHLWQSLSTGFTGDIMDFHGNASVVYLAGYLLQTEGRLLTYDGVGFTNIPLPSGTEGLWGVHVFPNGEVFAVGRSGTIIHGP